MRTFLQIRAITFVIWFSLFPLFLLAETEPNDVFSEANLLVNGIIMNGELGKTENSITDTKDWYRIEVTDNSVGEFSYNFLLIQTFQPKHFVMKIVLITLATQK